MKCILALFISVVFLSCTKEYSCEVNCRINVPATIDSVRSDTATTSSSIYDYYSQSYHVSLSGTGNNAWGYALPQFDTAEGILDTVEINISTMVSCNFELSNNSNSNNTCSVNFARKVALAADSLVLIDTNYTSSMGAINVNALSVFQDSLNVLNNVQLTSLVTSHLNTFTGDQYIAFNFDPYTSANVLGTGDAISASFHDSTYIHTTYHYKKRK